MTDIESKKKVYRNYLQNIRNLPSMPLVMVEVSKLLSNPLTSATDLGRLIGKDQGLVAKILTVANSPLYGLPRRVSTVEFAIVILGFDQIKNIVIALSMIEAFQSSNDEYWNRNTYWRHSLMTATAAKKIADELGYPRSGEAFTVGLLHDLGISVMQRYLNNEFRIITNMVNESGICHLAAEEEVLGLTHQDVGRFLADKWNLPSTLGDAILNHHTPSNSEHNRVLSSIVHLADFMTQVLQAGNFKWDDNYKFDENILHILNIGDAFSLQKFIKSYEDVFTKQMEIFK
ncbi:MAG: HDOD domain-containing protein [Ignavibacteriaceae bacterium]|nr:HDOD domain-containing protein [Ignavibacteriaceae bacterium]